MAAKLNELKQKVLTAKAALNALLEKQGAAKTTLSGLLRADTPDEAAITTARTAGAEIDAKVSRSREALQTDEEALHSEEQRIEIEDSQAKRRGRTETHDNTADAPWHSEADGPEPLAKLTGLGRWGKAVALAFGGQVADPRLQAAALGMNESSGEAGGYAVPPEYALDIEASMFKAGDLLSRVDSRSITGNSMSYTVMNETSRVDGSRQGGVLGYWLDEAGTKTASQMALARMEMKLRKVAALGYMTDELLEDAPALGQELQQAFIEELTFQVELKIYRGLGGATPLGILSAPSFLSQAAEGGQVAATILWENLVRMWARLPPRSQRNAVWLGNVETLPMLHMMTLAVGTGGDANPRFVTYGPNGELTIFGRPFVPVEYASALGTVGDIVLADLSKYRLIRKASGIKTASSIHVAFTTDQTVFRAVGRYDGQPVPRAVVTPYLGSNTLSPFVGLATRA